MSTTFGGVPRTCPREKKWCFASHQPRERHCCCARDAFMAIFACFSARDKCNLCQAPAGGKGDLFHACAFLLSLLGVTMSARFPAGVTNRVSPFESVCVVHPARTMVGIGYITAAVMNCYVFHRLESGRPASLLGSFRLGTDLSLTL